MQNKISNYKLPASTTGAATEIGAVGIAGPDFIQTKGDGSWAIAFFGRVMSFWGRINAVMLLAFTKM